MLSAALRPAHTVRALAVPLGLAALLIGPEVAAQRAAPNLATARAARALPVVVDTLRAYRPLPIPFRSIEDVAVPLPMQFELATQLALAAPDPAPAAPLRRVRLPMDPSTRQSVPAPTFPEVAARAQAPAAAPATAVVVAPEAATAADAAPAVAPAVQTSRVALLGSARRRVVLVPGVSRQESLPTVSPTPAADPLPGSRVVMSQVTVLVGEGGRRTVVFSEPSGRPFIDLGRGGPSGAGALQAGARLRGLRTTPLQRGMRGDAVLAAQQLLSAAGYAVLQNGLYDASMVRAVEAFQTDHNERAGAAQRLRVDGVFGHSTRRAVEASFVIQR